MKDDSTSGTLSPTGRDRNARRDSAVSSSSNELPAAGSIVAEKYEVERVLGAGGMGVVIAAKHLQLGRRVAIKFMRGEAVRDQSAVERFVREARAAVSLSSEHVARVLDVGTLENGSPFMVMEYLAGVDLAQVIQREGPLPVVRVASLLIQACEAIAEAHAQGIVHRDLKPANLFLTQRADGSALVKVLDFGISKPALAGAQQSLTMSGVVMGSPGYMSPEQVRSTKDVDARSDIWSLGVIIYELLTGVSPFLGETIGDTFARITSEPPPPIRNLRPDLPEALIETIARCLERNPAARLQNVGELAQRLAAFAPPDAAMLVHRIARLTGSEPRRDETLEAPRMTAALPGSGAQNAGAMQTDGSWLRSAGHTSRFGRSRATAAITGGGVLLVCVAIGLYWGFARVQASNPPAGPSAVAAAATVAPPPVTVPVAPPEVVTLAAPPPAPAAPPPVTSPVVDAGLAPSREPSSRRAAPPPAPPAIVRTPQPRPHSPSSATSSAGATSGETDLY
jgi:serine/threonine-protein kinase